MVEIQTCPRRMREIEPWEYKEGLDRWETNRWLLDPEEVRKKHAAEDARFGPNTTIHRSETGDLWLWTWGPPRTCSFCGSIHPDDAFRLLDEGWEQEFAKVYKAYLNPPGSKVRSDAFLASIRDHNREPGQGVPSVWSPVPPVKLYVQHLSKEQIGKLNDHLHAKR